MRTVGRISSLLLVLLLMPGTAPAQGLSADGLARLGAAIRADIDGGRYPGAVVLIERVGKVAYHEAFGRLGPDDSRPMPRDAIFRIYSMSKPITSVAAMLLVEDGRLRLDDPVAKFIPAFAEPQVLQADGSTRPATRTMTVRDLLRHTSGLIYGVFEPGSPLGQRYTAAGIHRRALPLAEWTERLAALPLAFEPGTDWKYGRSTDVLGRVIEVAAGQPLDLFMAERIFRPLGMADTGFQAAADRAGRVAGIGAIGFDPLQRPVNLGGGSGMVSTATDYLAFCRMLVGGGAPLLRPETVAAMTRDQLDGRTLWLGGHGFGYGFAVRLEAALPIPGSPGDYWWEGFGGTTFWIDPAKRLIVIGMIQKPGERMHFRRLLRELVYAALVD